MSQGNTIPIQNATHASQRCCETGRPVAVDPNTGCTICSCKLQTGSQTYLTRVPTLPEHIYGPFHSQYPSQHAEFRQSAFYPMDPGAADRLTEGYKVPLPGQVPVYYDHMFPAQPFPSYPQGFDFNAARRKNATRETTGPLKAWLNAHRKNPYPTKGEKVMLAIITRMTLTQVSTWFANARRRLKKDNIYGENDYDSDDKLSKDDSVSSQNSFTEEEKRLVSDTSGLSDISDVDIEVDDVTSRRKPLKKCVQRLFSPDIRNDNVLDRIPSPEEISSIPTEADPLKPSSTEDIQTNFLLPLDSILSLQNSTREKLSLENGEKENDKNCLTSKHLLDNNGRTNNKRKMEETDVIPASKKPKIWSISEIIS